MKFSARKIGTMAIVFAILLIPTYIAFFNYIYAQGAPVSTGSISKLEITDTKGNLYQLSADNPEAYSAISEFVALNDRATQQGSLPDPLVGTDFFEFKYYSYDRIMDYKYYFSDNPSEAYYVDYNGKAYHIDEKDAVSFLSTSYAKCLYDTTELPAMTISGQEVLPTTAEWAYKTYAGEYVNLDDIKTAAPDGTIYNMKGAFALNFETEPDYCNVTITDNGTVVYSDFYSNISNASLEGKTIDVSVDVRWYESGDSGCYGSAVYNFRAKILLPAVFYLGLTEVEPGEFVSITAKNVDDPSAITFTSYPDIGYTPKFFKDGSFVRALVPIDFDFGENSVKFTCTYGEVTQEMNLDIIPKTFKKVSTDINGAIVAQTRTASTLKAFDDAMAPIVAETSPTALWDGLFLEDVTDGGILNVGFGVYRTITATGETYRHLGVDYVTSEGKDVYAANNGNVVYAGYLDLSGYTVVIDHGMGLKSFYCHLKDMTVSVGASVTKGDVIGHVGSTGFTSRPALHIGYAIFDRPVCPYDLWEIGVAVTQ